MHPLFVAGLPYDGEASLSQKSTEKDEGVSYEVQSLIRDDSPC